MNTFLIILFVLIIIITSLGIIYTKLYNNINEKIIRIDTSENRITKSLTEKFELLDKSITILKENIKFDEKPFEDIIKFRARRIDNYDLNETLESSYKELTKIYDNSKKLKENLEITSIIKKIKLINEEMITLKEYHDLNVEEYNNIIVKFPNNIISKIKKLTPKKIFDKEEKEEN